jgi:hypothetical protein
MICCHSMTKLLTFLLNKVSQNHVNGFEVLFFFFFFFFFFKKKKRVNSYVFGWQNVISLLTKTLFKNKK